MQVFFAVCEVFNLKNANLCRVVFIILYCFKNSNLIAFQVRGHLELNFNCLVFAKIINIELISSTS